MKAESLTVVAQIKAKPGKESQVRQELLSLVAPSRQDDGCLNYDLHQAQFLGIIKDLSLPDQLLPLGMTLPLLGHVAAINVLPPIMVVMWILQQRAMPRPTEEQALLMYKMMMWMPIVMGIFLYNYAAGLSIYMITTSALGIIEQKYIKKRWPIDDTELPPKKGGGFMSKLMAAQEQRMKQVQLERAGDAKRKKKR